MEGSSLKLAALLLTHPNVGCFFVAAPSTATVDLFGLIRGEGTCANHATCTITSPSDGLEYRETDITLC